MQRITVSVLSFFVVFPAFCDARLPVVNLAAGSVSARSAFGEEIVKTSATPVAGPVKAVAKSENATPVKTVVARSAKKSATQKTIKKDVSSDSGEQIIAHADVLIPHRPSSDLWAKNDVPLRLPSPDEFSVMRGDYELPEEDLDGASVRVASSAAATENVAVSSPVKPMSEIDAQIARLNELQRRADESVVHTTPIVATNATRNIGARSDVEDTSVVRRRTENKNVNVAATHDVVSLSRMVVPMDSDVIVRAVEKSESPRIATVRDDMTKMSPTELRKAFRKTFLSENKHLSAYQIDDRFDVASDMTSDIEGFTAKRDLSESGGIRPLEIKIKFRNDDSALSRDNYNLLTEYAGIVLTNPTRAIQISIPQRATVSADERKLAARRLAIVEQVLRDTGVSEHRIMPVLSQRDEEGFVLRMISSDQYETLTQKRRDMFGDTVGKKTYKSMAW